MALYVPLGIDNFREVIEGGYVYVDKTLMIEEVIEQTAKVQLITRPRRFGKTLNLSMLAHFFDHRANAARLFHSLAIEKRPCFDLQGSSPVLFLSFKDLKAPSYQIFLELFRELVMHLFRAHDYLLEHLSTLDREDFLAFARGIDSEARLMNALHLLMRWLSEHHEKRVVLLIDEYDSPIHEGYAANYYEDVITFMRGTLGRVLKGNAALERAVLSGILRVVKESIFSDLNNIDVFTLLDDGYADKFGFTQAETLTLLERASLSNQSDRVRDWYNGYQVGGQVIYNPWSLLKFLKSSDGEFRPYWVNTSANLLVRDQLLHANPTTQDELKSLLSGGTVTTHIEEQTVFTDLKRNESTLWSFLLFSGYLTVASKHRVDDELRYTLRTPNKEVLLLYRKIIREWLQREFGSPKTEALFSALLDGDGERFNLYLSELVEAILSYYDTAGKAQERVYHAFVLGLLAHLTDRYIIKSNRESGICRYDVLMLPKHQHNRGIVMEFKIAPQPDQLEATLKIALKQIAEKGYTRELESAGVEQYSEFAIAFCGKQVRTRVLNRDL